MFAVLAARYYIDPRDEMILIEGRKWVPQYRVKMVKIGTAKNMAEAKTLHPAPVLQEIKDGKEGEQIQIR